jgi:hypothetical protein
MQCKLAALQICNICVKAKEREGRGRERDNSIITGALLTVKINRK